MGNSFSVTALNLDLMIYGYFWGSGIYKWMDIPKGKDPNEDV